MTDQRRVEPFVAHTRNRPIEHTLTQSGEVLRRHPQTDAAELHVLPFVVLGPDGPDRFEEPFGGDVVEIPSGRRRQHLEELFPHPRVDPCRPGFGDDGECIVEPAGHGQQVLDRDSVADDSALERVHAPINSEPPTTRDVLPRNSRRVITRPL